MNASKEEARERQRTCAGCGRKDSPEMMERFVHPEEYELLHDVRRRAPGRGSYVHPRRSCIERALDGGFARSFKRRVVTPELDALVASMSEAAERRLLEHLRIAVRSGEAAIGGRAVADTMKSDRVDFVFIASDAGEATREKFASNADRKEIPVTEAFGGDFLASATGHDFVAVVGIGESQADRLIRDVRALNGLRGGEG